MCIVTASCANQSSQLTINNMYDVSSTDLQQKKLCVYMWYICVDMAVHYTNLSQCKYY